MRKEIRAGIITAVVVTVISGFVYLVHAHQQEAMVIAVTLSVGVVVGAIYLLCLAAIEIWD